MRRTGSAGAKTLFPAVGQFGKVVFGVQNKRTVRVLIALPLCALCTVSFWSSFGLMRHSSFDEIDKDYQVSAKKIDGDNRTSTSAAQPSNHPDDSDRLIDVLGPVAGSEQPWKPPHQPPRRYYVPRTKAQLPVGIVGRNESGGDLLMAFDEGQGQGQPFDATEIDKGYQVSAKKIDGDNRISTSAALKSNHMVESDRHIDVLGPVAASEQPWKPPHQPPRRYYVPRTKAQLPVVGSRNESGGDLLVVFDDDSNMDEGQGQGSFQHKKPWKQLDLVPLNYSSIQSSADFANQTASLIRSTMLERLNFVLSNNLPQWPQFDHSTAENVALKGKIVGVETMECCPNQQCRQEAAKQRKDPIPPNLTTEELNDCRCRHPSHTATMVTAFYKFKSKHGPFVYKRFAKEMLQMSDPMIVFVEPDSEWEEFFTEKRRHAPTVIVPRKLEDLVLGTTFPESFWSFQHSIDPERTTHHKDINLNLYVIWNEKSVLLQTASILNPFNTTHFYWVDAGYCRAKFWHLHRNPAVRVNVTNEGVDPHSVLMIQMQPLKEAKTKTSVLVGGNSFGGTYEGIDNLYSSFYETMWQMAVNRIFVGSDQKIIFQMCQQYPSACHIHTPKKMRKWHSMLSVVLPGPGHTAQPELHVPISNVLTLEYVAPPDPLPKPPPNGVVVNKNVTGWKLVR